MLSSVGRRRLCLISGSGMPCAGGEAHLLLPCGQCWTRTKPPMSAAAPSLIIVGVSPVQCRQILSHPFNTQGN